MFKRLFHMLLLLGVFASLFTTIPVRPARAAGIIYVNASALGGNNGTSWANAYISLQTALAVATNGDEIWVAAGTYRPTTDMQRTISFDLKSGVEVYGGFAGTEASLVERDYIANVTILSGDIGTPNDTSDNSYHVVKGDGANATAWLDGFTITAGNANGINPGDRGGGMYNYTSSPSLANLIFSNNSAVGGGGGMLNYYNSHPNLTNVRFSDNDTNGSGGGMHNQMSSPTLLNVTFNDNTADNYGGGLYNDSSNPIISEVTFIGNVAAYGGGMRNIISDPSVTNTTFVGNTAIYGGGLQNVGSNPSLYNVTFSNNSATDGGGIYNSASAPSVRNSILYNNAGGEIFNYSASTPVITYSIIQGGYAGVGNLDVDPLLEPLANNGGITQTMALGIGSPAIDTGDDVVCPATDQRGVARPQGDQCDMGAYERLPTFLSSAAQDGWILEASETSNTGGASNKNATIFRLGDDGANKQYRAILSFDTSTLSENAVILSVTLRFQVAGISGANPFSTHGNLLADICEGAFKNNPVLELGDFKAPCSKNKVLVFTDNGADAWYSQTLNPDDFQYINHDGVTQFRLRFAKDDNNDFGADFLKLYSGNADSINCPQLVIEYYVP